VAVASADSGLFRFFRRPEAITQPALQAEPAAPESAGETRPIVLAATTPVPRPRPEVTRKLTAEDLLTYAASRGEGRERP
jgi:hypothetical protein